jgi:hypothetical protein
VLLDAASGELLAEASYDARDCQSPHEAIASSDGRMFLVCEGDHEARGSLVELEPESLAISRRLELGVYPDRMVLLEP